MMHTLHLNRQLPAAPVDTGPVLLFGLAAFASAFAATYFWPKAKPKAAVATFKIGKKKKH